MREEAKRAKNNEQADVEAWDWPPLLPPISAAPPRFSSRCTPTRVAAVTTRYLSAQLTLPRRDQPRRVDSPGPP